MNFFREGDVKSTLEFHTYLSDGKQQDSAVVNNHMEKLIQFLLEENVLKVGGHMYCHSDGCGVQYRCSTAYYFLSALSYKCGISISRHISAPGHGKCFMKKRTMVYYLIGHSHICNFILLVLFYI